MKNQCALIDGIIYCQCGNPSSHYGTMGDRGAREVRCEAPPAEQVPSKELVRDLRILAGNFGEVTSQYIRDAADEIERLERELYLLRNERDNLADNVHRLTHEPPAALTTYDVELFDVHHGGSRNGVAAKLIPMHNGRYYLRSDVDAMRASPPPEAIHKDGKFLRGWLQIDRLPGGMMVSNDGPFGPVPAMSSCLVTTSDITAKDWADKGKPVLEFRLSPTKEGEQP